VIPGEGRFVLAWYTEDEAGNATDKDHPQTKVIRYDRTPPTYKTPAFAFTTVNGGPVSQLGNFLTFGNYFKQGIRAGIYTEDNESGTAKILYTFDMGRTWKKAVREADGSGGARYYFDLPELAGGILKIGIITVDAAGNEAPQIWLSGDSGSSDWVFESQAPVIGPITARETMNADGWYHTPITLDINVQDEDSGLNRVTGTSTYDGSPAVELISENWDGAAAIVTDKEYHPRLLDDGTGIEVTVAARDNGNNETSATARFNIDTVMPVVSGITGWPQQLTDVQPEVTFRVADERSGVSAGGIQIRKDGTPIAYTYTPTDSLSGTCTFKLNGNGLYTIDVADTAGNPINTIKEHVDKIDTSGVEKLQVLLDPERPDGNEDWYLTCPSIEIVPLKQQGVMKLTTRYTLYKDGEAEPAPTLFLETDGAGTTGAENGAPTQPHIPSDGIWNLHVWTENSVGTTEHFRKEIKVDTHTPVDLYISDMPKDKAFREAPEIWTNKDVRLHAHAREAVSQLSEWSYTLDNGAHWSEWKPWSGDKSFELKKDCADENMIRFRARDVAGNLAESPSVTVLRDTEEPLLSMEEPSIGETGVPADTRIVLECSEPVWQLGENHGSLRIFNARTKSLWCEVKARDKNIEVNREKQMVEIRLPRPLESGTEYYVTVSRDFVTDIAGNESMEGGAARNWTFTTAGTNIGDAELYGFQVDLISGTPGTESTRRVMAVPSDSDQTRYSIAVRPEYMDREGVRKVLLQVLPLLTDPEGEVTLTADRRDVDVEALEDNIFEVTIPEGADRTRLTARTGGTDGRAYVLTVIQGSFSADAAGALNPEIEELEVLNSISLEEEFADSRARAVNLRIQVSRTDEDPKKAARYLLGEKLPADAKVQTLDIRMLKQVKNSSGLTDTDTIARLKNPVHITMDLETEYRGYKHIAIMRLHEDQASFLKSDMNQAKNRVTFRTDRFSDYMVICSDEDLTGLLSKPEQIFIVTATLSEASPSEPTYELQKPGLLYLAKHPRLPWWILLIALLILVYELERYRRERNKRRKELEALNGRHEENMK